MLLQLSQFFPLCPPPSSTSHFLRQFPQLCSHPWVLHVSSLCTTFSMWYFKSPWLFCNYQFVLPNPSASSPIFPNPLSIWQPSEWSCIHDCIHDSVSVLLLRLVCFLGSIVDRYVFIDTLLFIILIFFFLSKFL